MRRPLGERASGGVVAAAAWWQRRGKPEVEGSRAADARGKLNSSCQVVAPQRSRTIAHAASRIMRSRCVVLEVGATRPVALLRVFRETWKFCTNL